MADTVGVTRLMLNEDLRRLELKSSATFKPDLQTFFVPATTLDPQWQALYLYKYDIGLRLAVRLPAQPVTAEDFYLAATHIKTHGGVYQLQNNALLAVDANAFYYDLLNDAAQAGHIAAENTLIDAIIANQPAALKHLVHKEEVTYLIPSGNTSIRVKVMLPRKCVTPQEIHQLGKDLLLASKQNAGKDGCHNHYLMVNASAHITSLLGNALIDKAKALLQKNSAIEARRRMQSATVPTIPEISATTTLPTHANSLPPVYPHPYVLFQQEDRKFDDVELTPTHAPSPRF